MTTTDGPERDGDRAMNEDRFDSWAILELMGHVRMAGRVTEETRFGSAMGRIDVPTGDAGGYTTVYFGGSSVYRMTPTTEAVARAVARGNQPAPVHQWELPKPEVAPAVLSGRTRDEYRDDVDDADFGEDDSEGMDL